MAATARATPSDRPHIPVLLGPLLEAVAPVEGRWLDGTFGAGGYARGLLDAGADEVIGVDRDPAVFDMADGFFGIAPLARQTKPHHIHRCAVVVAFKTRLGADDRVTTIATNR